jgi:hypothetical protein
MVPLDPRLIFTAIYGSLCGIPVAIHGFIGGHLGIIQGPTRRALGGHPRALWAVICDL